MQRIMQCSIMAVSYTHLDVYKRQAEDSAAEHLKSWSEVPVPWIRSR